jgi:arsenate reductase-like glutaredoxin family protein
VEERDVTKAPPSRAFLEEHVGEDDFLDFVSRRSPIFKERPLPTTKREAIEMMLEHPNLIKRPIVIKGRKAIFGFDKEALEGLGNHGR